MKKLRLIIFILISLVQLGVPIYLIANRERVLRTGTEFHFKTRPVDPSDAFRGRYISLGFDFQESAASVIAKRYKVKGKIPSDILKTVTCYAAVTKDSDGFAVLDAVHDAPPREGDYVRITADVRWGSVFVHLPFNRFYMDEFDAPRAEKAYGRITRKKAQTTHAVVFIHSGETVLSDVVLDGLPIREYLKRNFDGEAKGSR